ncbi:putative reverse transcriptase domain-containing protein [Tanacetum coccineum]
MCAMGKSKKKPHKPKSEDTNQEKLYLLHMDLYGPMRVASVNGKKYILVIVDNYSRFTWVKCLRSKDEAPDFHFQVSQDAPHCGFKSTCQTNQKRIKELSLLSNFDVNIMRKKAFRNLPNSGKRTGRIIKTIHVDFDELTAMASEHSSSGPALHEMTPAIISSGLMPNPPPSTSFVPWYVTDIAQKDKNKAKRTKPSTGMERVREIKDECIFILNRPTQQVANLSTYPSQRFKSFCYDDDDDDDYEESTIPLRDIISKLPPSIAITPVLSTLEPEDSLIMGNEELSTIPEKESDKFIKSSVEDLVPIPSESEDTSESDSDFNLPSCDDFSPINVYEEKSDVPEDNVKIYSNPLFKFDDEYISSDVNPLFDEVLKDIECKDSYDSNLDESTFPVTLIFDSNKDEFFTPGDDIEFLLHHDPSTPTISVVSILEGFTDEPPLEENDDLFDLRSKENEWKKILYDAPIDDLMNEDKVFDPGIHEKIFSPTYASLTFEDRHYLFLTYVI